MAICARCIFSAPIYEKGTIHCKANMNCQYFNHSEKVCPFFVEPDWNDAIKASDRNKGTINDVYGINSMTEMEETKMLKGTILDKTLDVIFDNIKAGKKLAFIYGNECPSISLIDTATISTIKSNIKSNNTILILLEKEEEE